MGLFCPWPSSAAGAQQKNKFLALALGGGPGSVPRLRGRPVRAGDVHLPPAQAFLAASAPYLVRDVLSLVLAYGAARLLSWP